MCMYLAKTPEETQEVEWYWINCKKCDFYELCGHPHHHHYHHRRHLHGEQHAGHDSQTNVQFYLCFPKRRPKDVHHYGAFPKRREFYLEKETFFKF